MTDIKTPEQIAAELVQGIITHGTIAFMGEHGAPAEDLWRTIATRAIKADRIQHIPEPAKSPEDVAREVLGEGTGWHAGDKPALIDLLAAAIEADRAERLVNLDDQPRLTVGRIQHDGDALFLREAWADAQGEDGTEIEFCRTVGGTHLVLRMKFPDGTRAAETISISDLVQSWANTIENDRKK